MKKALFFLICCCALTMNAQTIALRPGIKITSSVKIKPAIYKINNETELFNSVIEIEGSNIVVDFGGAVMDGNVKKAMPDQFFGTAINIKAGKNITIKNLIAKGYKIALMAKNVQGLTIENCNFSYNYRQHLYSTQQKEDLSDWMSYHHNEKDEWLRYGAAMYLRGCNKAVVHDNIVTGGQCALMLMQCDSGIIYNNNFSFNSGIGIGMYRSSVDTVMYNSLNFNVRGHSEGVYNRGQDAAAILVFEQCNKNVYAFNSATHSGDGFFLWAGQTTMDNGEGGCNDNLILNNNFSYAPTNGIEVTFSRNKIFENAIVECDNGIWGGYSYETLIDNNKIEKCNTGIAIEHGQENKIRYNSFKNCNSVIKLWARSSQPADWGYANKRDTRSKNYIIAHNTLFGNKTAFDFVRTTNIALIKNDTTQNALILKTDSTVKDLIFFSDSNVAIYENQVQKTDTFSVRFDGLKIHGDHQTIDSLHGRRQIRMTEWGPYDFKYPLLWNTNPVSASDTMRFEIVGPKGNCKLIEQRGVKIISQSASAITAIKTKEKGEDIFIELEYTGKEDITTAFGERIAKGKKYRFSYRNNLLQADWKVKSYAFDSLQNPIQNPSFISELTKLSPVFSDQTNDLHYAWWSGAGKEEKYEQFLTVAEADTGLPPGNYIIGASWEDVVRIYIDGQLVLDEWKPIEHIYDESPHHELSVALAGKHHIRVEQANKAGFATLIIKLKKK